MVRHTIKIFQLSGTLCIKELRGGWGVGKAKVRCYQTLGDGGLVSPIFTFFIKENWIWVMTRHHANNILLTRNLPFDSDVRQ